MIWLDKLTFDLSFKKKKNLHVTHGVCMGQVKGIFWPNPTHMGRVEPMGWTNFIIIIKLSRKKNINILKKT